MCNKPDNPQRGSRERYQLADLHRLMARLRDPDGGCPWDLQQDYRSIVPHTIEEAYEVAEAIEQGDYDHLPDELGDLLFQVIFYARMGEEEGRFDFTDVVDGIVRKLLRRHPHIFPDGTLESRNTASTALDDAALAEQWQRIKAEEKALKGAAPVQPASAMDSVGSGLPGFVRARKLQQKASRLGFDWPDTGAVFHKLTEESNELKEAWQRGEGDPDAMEDELGDLLFVCVNLARFMDLDPEQALRRANRKFEQRFRTMEALLQEEGESNDGFSQREFAALEELWRRAKEQQRR
ncbi:MAG: nucleoside triphosphate pyrophosphohydrolase [Halomonadaceae bacterium]|nr:MAG: nucleoside triphosphate pyrophosphohydrolase [Halomonadaceae bacterium]